MAKKQAAEKQPERRELSRAELKHHVAEGRQLVIGMTSRPVSFVLNRFEASASTDCLRTVNINPRPLEFGLVSVFRGMSVHEAGHIIYSPWGALAMAEASKVSESLATIVNLLLDRKDDYLVDQDFPGVREYLHARRSYIMPHVTAEAREENLFKDFFYAVKGNARPITDAVKKALRLIRKRLPNYRRVTKADILDCASKCLELLREHATEDQLKRMDQEWAMNRLMRIVAQIEAAKPVLTTDEEAELMAIIEEIEREEAEALFPDHSDLSSVSDPPPRDPDEVGQLTHEPPEVDVDPAPAEFDTILANVAHLVQPLRRWLELLSPSDVQVVRGLEQGNPDSTQLARVTLGADDVHSEDVIVRENSVTAAFALDTSGSTGRLIADGGLPKISYGKELGVVFNAAFAELPNTTANTWMYDSVIRNCGSASLESGIATATPDKANCDSYMAAHLWRFFRENPAETMVAIFAADGGPDSFDELENQLRGLRRIGVTTVQFFIESEVGRDGESSTRLQAMFDYRIVFRADTIDTMVEEFGRLLERVYG